MNIAESDIRFFKEAISAIPEAVIRGDGKCLPLEVTFRLSAPIAMNYAWLSFDSLITRLVLLQSMGEKFYLMPRNAWIDISRAIAAVPILRTGELFHASFSVLDNHRTATEIRYKRFEDRWAGGKKRVKNDGGFFINRMIRHLYLPATTVTFYVNGDLAKLAQLCESVDSLGSNPNCGWGAVRGFEIRETPGDWSLVKDGVAMRPIPVELVEYASETWPMSWKTPYWMKTNVVMCVPPGAEVRLKRRHDEKG